MNESNIDQDKYYQHVGCEGFGPRFDFLDVFLFVLLQGRNSGVEFHIRAVHSVWMEWDHGNVAVI